VPLKSGKLQFLSLRQRVSVNSDETSNAESQHPSSLAELGRRLSAVLDLIGSRSKAAEIAERSTDQLAKYSKGSVEPPFLPLARLCRAARVRIQWLAFAEEPKSEASPAAQSESPVLRLEALTMAIQLVEEALEGKTLEPAKRAELFGLVYEGLVEGMPEATVLRWARAAAR
jgi:hypothetical protein